MYSLREMRVARRLLCSGGAWASTASIFHEANTIRSVIQKRGNSAIQTTLEATPCLHQSTGSRSVIWEHYYSKNLQRASGLKTCTWTFLGFSYATSFLAATEQGAIQCDSHDGVFDGFKGSQQTPEITEIIAEDSLEMEPHHKLLNFIKRYWWPTVFLLTVLVGYPYPKSLLPNTLLLMWSTKPHPASIYLWLKKRRETSQTSQGALDQMKNKLNSAATVMHVEVQDYMFFCLAKVTYLTSNATIVGVLGEWWIVYSSSSRITALGLSTSFASPATLCQRIVPKEEVRELEHLGHPNFSLSHFGFRRDPPGAVIDTLIFCAQGVEKTTSSEESCLTDGEHQDFVNSHLKKLLLTCIRLYFWMVGLDNVPNLDNFAKDFKSKKEELEAEFKKVTEDGLKKYKNWIEKLLPGVSWVD